MKKKHVTLVGLITTCLLIARLATIAGDIQAVIEDPNEANKPREILKLFFDLV